MKSGMYRSGTVGFLTAISQTIVQAADVAGEAYKYGATDHSGISIRLEAIPSVPALGVFGAGVLFFALSAFLLRRKRRKSGGRALMAALIGFTCITHAYFVTETSPLGEWAMSGIDAGQYQLDATADGYYPEHREPISVAEGMNIIPDIILYPIETATPSPFPTATAAPSETPDFPPTETPTETPVATGTGQPSQTPTPVATIPGSGELCSMDSIVGNMRCIAGTDASGFTQGSPNGETCRDSGETLFTHVLTLNIAVMETEITRQMWSDLRLVQTTLPVDPSNTGFSPGLSYPVQNVTWFEAVLFANLLSAQNGFGPCYFTDSAFSIPVDSSNYATGPFFCDWIADGYRLPAEGEWEYICRAGTTGPFSCPEPNYDSSNCLSCAGLHYTLDDYCTYCGNDSYRTDPAGSRLANAWNLRDVHGNVMEWCWDWRTTYPSGTRTDYRGPSGAYTFRVTRGGGWEDTADDCRSAERGTMNPPGFRGDRQGFRLVRTF